MSEFWTELNKIDESVRVPSSLNILKTRQINDQDKAAIKEIGLELSHLRHNDSKFLLTEQGPIRNYVGEEADEVSRKIHFADWAVQMYANSIKSGAFLAVCPVSGKLLSSRESIPFGNNFTRRNLRMCAYRFESDFVFYIITGQLWAEKIGMYIPEMECFIQLGNRNVSRVQITRLLAKWKQWIRTHNDEIRKYLTSDEKHTSLVISYPTNFYHYLCNGLASLDRLNELNVLRYIRKMYVNSFDFFGAVDDIFPSLESKVTKSSPDTFDIDVLKEDLFIMAPSHITLRVEFIEALKKSLISGISKSMRESIDRVQEKSDLIVLIYVKINRRQWIQQVDGLTQIFNRLSKKYGKISVIFTGFTFPSTIDEVNHESLKSHYKEYIDAEKDVINGIRDGLNSESVQLIDIIGEKMDTVLAWCESGDFYISPGGVGMVPFTLFANKPGIFHSNTAVNEIPIKNRPYCFEREDINIPFFLNDEDVEDIKTEESKASSHADSYNCDWKAIYDIIEGKLNY